MLSSPSTHLSQGKRHVHTLLYRVPRAKVVAVCTTEPSEIQWATENQEYRDFSIQVYGNYDEMLAQPGLQAVWVSTSTDVHASQTLAAIAKGVHVLCEKPLSTDLAEVWLRLHVSEEMLVLILRPSYRRNQLWTPPNETPGSR